MKLPVITQNGNAMYNSFLKCAKMRISEHTSAILAAILDFSATRLMEKESAWPLYYMSVKHSVPLQAIFKELLSYLSKFDL